MSAEANYLKLRRVKPRYYGEAATFECKIIGHVRARVWDTLGTSRGHATAEAAISAAGKLADKRGINLTDDPRVVGRKLADKALRAIEFSDTYGDAEVVP